MSALEKPDAQAAWSALCSGRPIWRDYGERHAGILGEADDIYFVRSAPGPVLICWDWYFGAIMEGVSPGVDGWTALALEYHVACRWMDGPWRIPAVAAVVEQLRGADRGVIARTPFGTQALPILDDLVAFLEAALIAEQSVTLLSW